MTTVAVGGRGGGVGGGDNRDGRCERCRTFNPRQIAVKISAHYHHGMVTNILLQMSS